MCHIPLSNVSIFVVFTYRLVNICKKKTFCILKHLKFLNSPTIYQNKQWESNDESKERNFTFDSKGKASNAVLRRMMLDINIWLFLALSIPKTSFVTFFGLKQK